MNHDCFIAVDHEVVVRCALNKHDFTFCWVIPPAPPPDVSVLQSAWITLTALSMAVLYPEPSSSPPESTIQVQNKLILWCLQRLVLVWLSFVSTFSCRKHMSFPKHSSFLSNAGLNEDRLRLQIMYECSWLSSCDVCYSKPFFIKK